MYGRGGANMGLWFSEGLLRLCGPEARRKRARPQARVGMAAPRRARGMGLSVPRPETTKRVRCWKNGRCFRPHLGPHIRGLLCCKRWGFAKVRGGATCHPGSGRGCGCSWPAIPGMEPRWPVLCIRAQSGVHPKESAPVPPF